MSAKNDLDLGQRAKITIGRGRKVENALNLKGRYYVEHWRDGELLKTMTFNNGIVNEGKNFLLNVMFSGTTPITTWYLGMIDLTGYTALANDDTYDDINQAGNGWDEFADYTDGNNSDNAGTRPAWPEDGASGQSITNTTLAIYDITDTGTVKGLFSCGGTNAQTKGDHTASGNVLFGTALFDQGDTAVNNGDQLRVAYAVSA